MIRTRSGGGTLIIAVFAGIAVLWQLLHFSEKQGITSIGQSAIQGEQLARISSLIDRDKATSPIAGSCRFLEMVLPKDARVFVTNMTGKTNSLKGGIFFYLTYYLFPREIGVNLDGPARMTKDGLVGRTSTSDQEILTSGFDVRIDVSDDGQQMNARPLRKLDTTNPTTSEWFDSATDIAMAFLLPLFTALGGIWLFDLLFPALKGTAYCEKLACGLGLGMMAVAALTLAIKLCGFHGQRVVFIITAIAAGVSLWRDRARFQQAFKPAPTSRPANPSPFGIWSVWLNPILVLGVVIFLILFRLAALQGITEFDAVMAWSLKAKILHLYTGTDIVHWLSNPRLAHAHLDYPTLVPALHAATYDSLGHVNEFVTKFWPTWMLLLLLAAMTALCSAPGQPKKWFHPLWLALLAVLLLPATQEYVQMEGAVMPMVFYTALGLVQCLLWRTTNEPARLLLGLTLLFGAAMTKQEGAVFLGLGLIIMLLSPASRAYLRSLLCSPLACRDRDSGSSRDIDKPSRNCSRSGVFRVGAFAALAALPYICLRLQIPAIQYEAGWFRYALQHPGTTASNWPVMCLAILSRWFISPSLDCVSDASSHLHWTWKWDGISSFYNHSTLGLAWFCLALTILTWVSVPSSRKFLLWMLATFLTMTVFLSVIFASVGTINPAQGATYTSSYAIERYIFPLLIGWFLSLVALNIITEPKERDQPQEDSRFCQVSVKSS